MSTVVNPMPGDGQGKKKEVEVSPEAALQEIQKRMEDLKSGAKTPDDFKKEHLAEIVDENKKADYPTLRVDLPSKGILYPDDNPLSLGYVELKYMTAKEEDILTTESYIKSGVVLDKLFQSLIVSKIDYDSMLIGDRDAIMIASRIYGYGEDYETKITTPSGNTQKVPIDLNDIPHKELDESLYTKGVNEFEFKTSTGDVIRFKLLTNGDQKQIQESLKKVKHGGGRDTQLTTRLFHMILSVNGNEDRRFIKAWIENDFRALDSRKFRDYVAKVQPGVDMTITIVDQETGEPFRTEIAIGLDFLWVNLQV